MAGLAEVRDDVKLVEVAVVVLKLEDGFDVELFKGRDSSNTQNIMVHLFRDRQSLQQVKDK